MGWQTCEGLQCKSLDRSFCRRSTSIDLEPDFDRRRFRRAVEMGAQRAREVLCLDPRGRTLFLVLHDPASIDFIETSGVCRADPKLARVKTAGRLRALGTLSSLPRRQGDAHFTSREPQSWLDVIIAERAWESARGFTEYIFSASLLIYRLNDVCCLRYDEVRLGPGNLDQSSDRNYWSSLG